ncbi:MAG TPA: hypothetical protein ENN79_04100 [Desulfobacteraceae bacterium]|nr:hypothetical protein [Desulfobacteraceae bacterium]
MANGYKLEASDAGCAGGFDAEASRMTPLLPDESPASKPPPQPLFSFSSIVVVVSGAQAKRLSLSSS